VIAQAAINSDSLSDLVVKQIPQLRFLVSSTSSDVCATGFIKKVKQDVTLHTHKHKLTCNIIKADSNKHVQQQKQKDPGKHKTNKVK
jgi:hypothetical protein